MKLTLFKEIDFLNAVKALFTELKVPMNYVTDEPTTARKILKDTYKDNSTFALVDDVYFVGMVDDAAFEGNQSISTDKIKSDYDGVLIFGITLHQRENNLLPTRSQLAEISRAFNREFYYTPVVLVFKYQDNVSEYLAFANTERLKYKQEWREGEKAGKVSLLRDINIKKPHRGHEDIITQLRIPTSGTKQVDSFAKLYNYWQEVFSVSILNKKFYKELQNWYFWAIQEVSFPNQPNILDENIDGDETKLKEAIKEHKGKNVIRLLTRILFIWFIKEKKLIPEEIFDEETIADKLINDFTPQKPHGLFSTGSTITKNSKYYRAILQNLFFATLNQEMGKRTFRNNKQHQNVTNLMRYKSYFKNPDYFVQLMEDIVPFMNGGLFECLDKPHPDKKGKLGGDIIIYTDGFSDRADNPVVVPDYLFFDVDEDVDLSDDFGSKSKVYKNAKTRGLLEILKSYKFTITENTPIEEDVALDPELLGKVFENLLASYNPETKTTARKQTGSFYTPREIVNYMVDESLIAYLKSAITDWNLTEEELDKNLHQLFSFDEINPFEKEPDIQKQIIKALDRAKILDPAAGSGAFPMGVLQKMVHVLHKVDPQSTEWKQRQIDKVNNAIVSLEEIDDEKFREQSIKELKVQINDIVDAFENNELDYGRKLFLIENCIYGVDIQSIATQISKLRFFISLIVDQKIDKSKPNFGIRPLPNLETKFVAANTLIGIDKPDAQLSMFGNTEVKKLETQLKKVRHKIFSSKSPKRKRELREDDKNLREKIAELLEDGGMENKTASQLASWDPYDQNASSTFFDPEWMFDIKQGFDVVIGNPPYIGEKGNEVVFHKINKSELYRRFYTRWMDYFYYFFHKGIDLLTNEGILSYITTNYFFTSTGGVNLRKDLKHRTTINSIVNFNELKIFETARGQHNSITILSKGKKSLKSNVIVCNNSSTINERMLIDVLSGNDPKTAYYDLETDNLFDGNDYQLRTSGVNTKSNDKLTDILSGISKNSNLRLSNITKICMGVVTLSDKFTNKHESVYPTIHAQKGDGIYVLNNIELESLDLSINTLSTVIKPFYKNSDIYRYGTKETNDLWLIYLKDEGYPIKLESNLLKHFERFGPLIKGLKENFLKNEIAASVVKKWFKNGNYFVLFTPKKEKYFTMDKIVFPYRSKRNTFAFSSNPFFGSKDIGYIMLKNNNYALKFLLAILNSNLMYFWLYNRGKRKGETLELYAKPIGDIPISYVPMHYQLNFVLLVLIQEYLMHMSNSLSEIIDQINNSMVYESYFPEHMKEREIDVLQFVDQDIKQVMRGREFEKLNDTEKEEVIEQLHLKWTDPNNEVVKHMSMFKEKSPDILKPILES